MEYYEELIVKIQELESQRGTKQDYLMLLNIRRSLVSYLCVVNTLIFLSNVEFFQYKGEILRNNLNQYQNIYQIQDIIQ